MPLLVNFGTKKTDDGASYQWTVDGKDLKANEASYRFLNHGDYDLTSKAVSSDGCELSQAYPSYFHAYEQPKASFSFSPHTTLSNNPLISFTNQSTGASQYSWFFGDGEKSNETHLAHLFSSLGRVGIKLVAKSEFGCIDSISDYADIVGSTTVPNAFSPHSNVEKNRVFYPIPQGMQVNNYELKVYNRWGNVVFISNDSSQGWDGSINGSEKAAAGAFVWTLTYDDQTGAKHKDAGTVLVL